MYGVYFIFYFFNDISLIGNRWVLLIFTQTLWFFSLSKHCTFALGYFKNTKVEKLLHYNVACKISSSRKIPIIFVT